MLKKTSLFLSMIFLLISCSNESATSSNYETQQWMVYEGGDGPGKGKHVVFISGDEEYRSEEALPQLAKIFSKHHGFKSTVLFSINKKTGLIDPETLNNIPGLEALESADLMIMALRFRELPEDQMKYIIDYTNSGKPIIGLRTSTHPFNYVKNKKSKYFKYTFNNEEFEGGYGRQVLGETWVSHHGAHGKESTRGYVAKGMENHPIIQGTEDIWGPTDVYGINDLTGDSEPLIMGQVLTGMNPSDPHKESISQMPIAWIKSYTGETGNKSKVFTSTMGAATDFESEGLRRLLVNAAYWGLNMENQIPERSNVDIVGEFNPTDYGFGTHIKNVKVSSHSMD